MDSPHWPLILIEGVLVFGGALLFGWWQLRSVKRDRARMAEERARQAQADQSAKKQTDGRSTHEAG